MPLFPSSDALVPSSNALVPSIDALVPSSDALVPSSDALVPSSNALVPSSDALVPSSDALVPSSNALVPSSDALVPTSDALATSSFLLLVVMPWLLVAMHLLLVVMPLATSSVLATSENIRRAQGAPGNVCQTRSPPNPVCHFCMLMACDRRCLSSVRHPCPMRSCLGWVWWRGKEATIGRGWGGSAVSAHGWMPILAGEHIGSPNSCH